MPQVGEGPVDGRGAGFLSLRRCLSEVRRDATARSRIVAWFVDDVNSEQL
jgi:hypothetical protein